MTEVAKEAAKLRAKFNAERLNLEQIAYWLGFDRKTAERKISHLPYFDDGAKRYEVTVIAEYVITHTKKGEHQ